MDSYQRFEDKSRKRGDHQSEDAPTKCCKFPWVPILQNETVPKTYGFQQKGKTLIINSTKEAGH